MQAKDTCILTLVCHKNPSFGGARWGGLAQQHCLVLLNTVSQVVPLWEIQRACAEKA